jgi:hypothetical protein
MSDFKRVLEFMDDHPAFFKKDRDWFISNWHIVKAFESIALRLISRGRGHYSARTIVEVLVHDSLMREVGGTFKIGNDNAPDLARVFVILHPHHVDFWEYRRPDWRHFVDIVKQDVPDFLL